MHARWQATVYYRTDNGTVDVQHLLGELRDLHGFVEAGPHWDTIQRIEIVRIDHCEAADLTVEQSAAL
jgi:hypothetical protein